MSLRTCLVVLSIAVGLTVLFWGPLWQGDGLQGGDMYTYFFPQKLVYAEQLAESRVPLWNPLVGFGYPLLAESQAGVFYPPNPLLYRQFDVNTAYNISQLGHYVLAFVFTWLLLRRLDLSPAAATLGAIVFVYGWFPARICLEWSIIGGVYFPLAVWCVESFLQSRHRRWLVILAISQGAHLLAGHFNLAFITQLTCVAYAGLRLLLASEQTPDAAPSWRSRASVFALIVAAIGVGFALAAVQLLPTWELKQLSQREGVGAAHDPGYGHIPPWYLSQIVAPWFWYPDDVDSDQALQAIRVLTIDSATNRVEAHLYFGLIPLLLILYRLSTAYLGEVLDRRHRLWLWLGLAAMVYATGWLLPISRHLPGFSFFMGPGRYGIVTTLGAALLAGAGLDVLLRLRRGTARRLIIGLAMGLTVIDLYWVAGRQTVGYAQIVEDPPIQHVEESAVRELLQRYEAFHGPLQPVRMLARGPNWATLTGFAAYPAYLGIGPAAYFDPALTMPEPNDEMSPAERTNALEEQRKWLRQGAFTHILSMEPLDEAEWPNARLVWQGFDVLLSRVYALRDPLSLYELTDPLPRIRLEGGEEEINVEANSPALMGVTLTAPTGGTLVWADLAFPGWVATIARADGTEQISTDEGLFRRVPLPPGEAAVVWTYSPESFRTGAIISGVTLILIWGFIGRALLRRHAADDSSTAVRPSTSM